MRRSYRWNQETQSLEEITGLDVGTDGTGFLRYGETGLEHMRKTGDVPLSDFWSKDELAAGPAAVEARRHKALTTHEREQRRAQINDAYERVRYGKGAGLGRNWLDD